MHDEALGRIVVRVADAVKQLEGDRRRLGLAGAVVALGRRALEVGDVVRVVGDDGDRPGLGRVRLGEGPLEAILEVAVGAVVLVSGDVASADEGLGVQRADAALLLDEVVHQRLGHRGVVALVVTTTAVADEVDHDVALELLAVREGELGDARDGLGVVAVHVEDGAWIVFATSVE